MLCVYRFPQPEHMYCWQGGFFSIWALVVSLGDNASNHRTLVFYVFVMLHVTRLRQDMSWLWLKPCLYQRCNLMTNSKAMYLLVPYTCRLTSYTFYKTRNVWLPPSCLYIIRILIDIRNYWNSGPPGAIVRINIKTYPWIVCELAHMAAMMYV